MLFQIGVKIFLNLSVGRIKMTIAMVCLRVSHDVIEIHAGVM